MSKYKIKDSFIKEAVNEFRKYAAKRGAFRLPRFLTVFSETEVAVLNRALSEEACAGTYYLSISEDAVTYRLTTAYDNDPQNGETLVVRRNAGTVYS